MSFINIKQSSKIWLGCSIVLFALGLGMVTSMISYSSFDLRFDDLWGYWFSFDETNIKHQIFSSLRAPRLMISIVIGINLAIAGLLMQGLTANPLASPSILGINAGASCFIALSSMNLVLLPQLPLSVNALLGGLVSGLLVLSLGGFFTSKSHPIKLILAGIAVNALLIGITRSALILMDDMAYSVLTWLAGSIANVSWEDWAQLWPISVVGVAMALSLAHSLNLLNLGDDMAIGLGVNLTRTRVTACIAILLLTTSSVAIVGPITFVGLLVPHIARKLVGTNHFVLLPITAALGASLLLWSDVISRMVVFPAETPIGVITALIGSPFFIALTVRSKIS
ncbi:FecCD family ABC transporter permease [Vibrio sagamiensis]|uniref:Iron ABC transporter n=1 Tax=Vibrio sagamiensis NBRC 104589 TaxID=1219064 RepID=A0A511QEH4_9VIBR|nr:iron chelate uptake ABC transporter family permease subunit [Vibrio sagamiensis]PNQ58517.1 iron ABC transporter [Vibrio agarivorans]GEM75698.1 iron ABC transporter [Vibrio sagamiensis NBRC 104589]